MDSLRPKLADIITEHKGQLNEANVEKAALLIKRARAAKKTASK